MLFSLFSFATLRSFSVGPLRWGSSLFACQNSASFFPVLPTCSSLFLSLPLSLPPSKARSGQVQSPPLRDFAPPHSLLYAALTGQLDRLRLSLQPITVKTSSLLSLPVSFVSLSSFLHPRAASSAFLNTPPVLRCTVLFTPKRRYAKRRGKMPPKKQVEEKKILLGRPGNNLKSGIVSKIFSFPPPLPALPLVSSTRTRAVAEFLQAKSSPAPR